MRVSRDRGGMHLPRAVSPGERSGTRDVLALDSGAARTCVLAARTPSLRNLARGLPVSEVRESALEAAEVASTISTQEIVNMVAHACHLANEPQGELITTTLLSRCARAQELTDEYLMRIGATR